MELKVHNLSGRLGMSYIRVCQFILDGPRTITGSQEVQSRTKATGCTSNGMYQKRMAIFLGLQVFRREFLSSLGPNEFVTGCIVQFWFGRLKYVSILAIPPV